MHQTSPKSASSGFLKRLLLAGSFLIFSGTAASAQCDTPAFSSIPTSITAYTTANTCSPAITIAAILANPTGVNLAFKLRGATLDSGSGIGSGHIFNRGITHLTISATRACVTKNFFLDVIVKDTIKPVLSHANITVNATPGLCGANVPYAAPSMTDNCPNCSFNFLKALGFEYLGSFGGHEYFLTPANLKANFDLIDAEAGTVGAHLASINSAAENAFLEAAIPDSVIVWFGYTDRDVEGTLKWTDGSTSTYTNWCDGEPDNFMVDQNYAIMHSGGLSGPTGCWDDAQLAVFPGNGAINDFQGIIELDKCGTSLVKIAGLDSNAFFPIGVNKVTYLAEDASGNEDSITFTVTVLGNCKKTCDIAVTSSDTTFTGGVPTNIYIGYGAQSATLTASATCTGAKSYLWTGPTSLLSCTTCQNPVFTPTTGGTFTFNSRIVCGSDTFKCSVTFCVKDIRVPANCCKPKNNNKCDDEDAGAKVYLCHAPPGNPSNSKTLCLPLTAVRAHLKEHEFDQLGQCGQSCGSTARLIKTARRLTQLTFRYIRTLPTTLSSLRFLISEGNFVTVSDIQGKVLQTRKLSAADDHKLRFELGRDARGIYMIDVIYDDHRYRTKIVMK